MRVTAILFATPIAGCSNEPFTLQHVCRRVHKQQGLILAQTSSQPEEEPLAQQEMDLRSIFRMPRIAAMY